MKYLAFDLETTTKDIHSCGLLGFALSVAPYKGYYIAYTDDENYNKTVLETLKPLFEDASIEKIGHNLKFDIKVLKRYGITVKGRIHDTMVADYVLFPNRKKHGLKLLSILHFNYKQIEFGDIAIGPQKNKTLVGVDLKKVTDYACEDVDQTLQLYSHLVPQIYGKNLQEIYDLDCALVSVIADMENNGITIDTLKVNAIADDLTKDCERLLCEMQSYTKKTFNINSTKQLNEFLFNELQINPIGSKGKNGLYSTSRKVLLRLTAQHPVISKIIEYRGLVKVQKTFIPALGNINPVTGKLHTSINQTVTETGRLSSSNPNLQNIPSRTSGKRLREVFTASSPNHILIGADYSNIELRVMAAISMDKTMIHSYKNGIDLHSLTAAKIFNKPFDTITKEQRNVGKIVNFGLIYGMSAHGLRENLFVNGGMDYSLEFCEQMIHDYFELYQGVAKCREELIYEATINSYAQTLLGRKRPLKDINSLDPKKRENAKRLALNTPIQGTAADIIKIAMVNIHKRILSENLQSKMILQVHDELLFDVPNDEAGYMSALIKYEMENAFTMIIPLEVELKTGSNWSETH
ncbi:DNA polymerase [Flavobacterium sp. SM15]|uniref:DNA polymerase n=1 Tax=Flavobacterium sp. SM15 TaxID=2908005 RepID=UPI001EDC3178|nr:DNA polymerase [Flavobacterium sp. SM15]MCG2609988.1 DNA polymerase [Flavobacterium sp. SM15]